ncbi:MAG: hypothetical protein O8C64_02845 [Candidatus Methanoperedens sp.]|nr:hypothetical protein [Candidatus Methanoperedens sp.]MCZ7406496.1 hypothetical protein [Candidatus Methanoperedens sp.]
MILLKEKKSFGEIIKWRRKIKEKDLENLATEVYRVEISQALDDHYKDFEEYRTPKSFIKYMGLKPSETEY